MWFFWGPTTKHLPAPIRVKLRTLVTRPWAKPPCYGTHFEALGELCRLAAFFFIFDPCSHLFGFLCTVEVVMKSCNNIYISAMDDIEIITLDDDEEPTESMPIYKNQDMVSDC